MKRLLVVSLCVRTAMRLVFMAVGVALVALLLSIRADVVELPRLAVETRGALVAEVQATRREVLAEVDHQAGAIRADAGAQVSALRTETLARVDALTGILDNQTSEALRIADSRAKDAVGSIDALRKDLAPVLTNAATLAGNGAALTQDVKDSLDDLYPDIRGTVASATVAVTSAAQASEAVRDAAPKLAESGVSIGQSFAGIALDVRREADELTKPKTTLQKVSDWAKLSARLLAAWF